MKNVFLPIALCSALITNGCATIISDNENPVQFDTTPTEAICTVEGKNYKEKITTPANLTLPAKASPVTVECTKEGFYPAQGSLITKMDGSIFGNLIFGGVVGVVVDSVTRSGFKYPKNITLTLFKQEFASEEEKNTYYQTEKNKLNAEIASEKAEALEDSKDNEKKYARLAKKIDETFADRLAILAEHEKNAVVKVEDTAEINVSTNK